MAPTVMVLGLLAEAVAWWLVAARDRDVWSTVVPVIAVMGGGALALESPPLARGVTPAAAGIAGLAAGVGLYLLTRAFVLVVRGWTAFREHSIRTYERRGSMPIAVALLLSVGVAAVAEELFWRGLFQANAARGLHSQVAGALAAWGAFVAANLPSANLAVIAGAVVGGAAWGLLALWTKGVLASLLCHGAWTGLMIAFPAVRTEDAAA